MERGLYKPTPVCGVKPGTKLGSGEGLAYLVEGQPTKPGPEKREEKSILVLQPPTLRTSIGINNNIYNSWFPSRE